MTKDEIIIKLIKVSAVLIILNVILAVILRIISR